MNKPQFILDYEKLQAWQESLSKIANDIKVMDSQVNTSNLSNLDFTNESKKVVEDRIENGKKCTEKIEEFISFTSVYISLFGLGKLKFARIEETERRKFMKTAGDIYEQAFDFYISYWNIFNLLGKYNFLPQIDKQPHVD